MIEISNKTKNKIDLDLVKTVSEAFLKKNKAKEKELSIVFVSDSDIKKINKEYRGKDSVTDVLSFEGDEDFLGEILIDYAQIKRQAKEFNNKTEEELVFILVHGLLHLIGYDDVTEDGRLQMEELGNKFIEEL